MRNLPTFEEFINEVNIMVSAEYDTIIDVDRKKRVKPTRYLIHVASPNKRQSILKNGLIPRDASNTKWGYLAKEMGLKTLYKNSLFAVTWKNSIDVYDAQNVGAYIFPLPMLMDYLPDAKQKMIDDLKDELEIKIKKYVKDRVKDSKMDKYSIIEYDDIIADYTHQINMIMQNSSQIDVWLIDADGLNNIWYEDHFSGDLPNGEAVWTDKKIPPENLILLKPNNQDVILNIDDFKDVIGESRLYESKYETIDGIKYEKRHPNDILIRIDIEKVLERLKTDNPEYFPSLEVNWTKNKIQKAKEFWINYGQDQRLINPRTGQRTNTIVTFEPSVCSINNGKLGFIDGRHRLLAMKDIGYKYAVIEIPKNQKDLFKELQ